MITVKQDRMECPPAEAIATSNSTIEPMNVHDSETQTQSQLNKTITDSSQSSEHKSDVTYRVGVAEDTNFKFRRSMEDVHTYVKNFASRLDWGYFAIFDGHAGSQASEWCGSHLHTMIEKDILEDESKDIREILNDSFVQIDKQINSKLEGNSGCTAAVCVLRWELPDTNSAHNNNSNSHKSTDNKKDINEEFPIALNQHKRKLYTANVGDSRIVLFRNGNSIRLTYDHKASDILEMQRVEAAGGLIMKSRVNGMLAVTRSLGDKFFDTLVIGNPFTTSVEITTEDKFLIIACDGLWDVIDDQEACELIQDIDDPNEAASVLVKYALNNGTTDNITVMVVMLS